MAAVAVTVTVPARWRRGRDATAAAAQAKGSRSAIRQTGTAAAHTQAHKSSQQRHMRERTTQSVIRPADGDATEVGLSVRHSGCAVSHRLTREENTTKTIEHVEGKIRHGIDDFFLNEFTNCKTLLKQQKHETKMLRFSADFVLSL